MAVLERLEPAGFFQFFEELSAIPHGSRNTRAVSDWCVRLARERGLRAVQDKPGNVIIFVPATPGYEDAPPFILQGHLDMVCEKTLGCTKDMQREGLDLRTDGQFVWAQDTTLGADNGVAVAYMLAIMDDRTLSHPPLELVFTTEEEIGMLGALDLDVSPLQGRQMINMDSEMEDVLTVGCAGGSMATCTLPLERAACAGSALRITVKGLTGGHSGSEIHRGRASAPILMGRLLYAAARCADLRLVTLTGGEKDNAISTAAEAVCRVSNPDAVRRTVEALGAELKQEYRDTDPGMEVAVEEAACAEEAMTAEATRRCIAFLTCAPHGVQAMNPRLPGLVQTSLNLGILLAQPQQLTAVFCVRSDLESQKQMLHDRLRSLTELLGGTVDVSGDYPPWAYREDSSLLRRAEEVFLAQFGTAPKLETTHGGLECGILCGKLPGLDCLSLGPNQYDVHTPRERMDVASIRRVWALLTEILKRSR